MPCPSRRSVADIGPVDETKNQLPDILCVIQVPLLEENIMPRANLPPLLVHLRDRSPEKLHYLGVSFGLTQDLYRFWSKLSFAPFYICQIPNDVTGEHNCMVLKSLNRDEFEDVGHNEYGFVFPYYKDFRERFIQLLSSCFRWMDYKLAMSIMHLKKGHDEKESDVSNEPQKAQGCLLSPYAMKRLEDYTNNFVDYHTILDIVPILARSYFLEKLPVALSHVQESIVLCMGLQNHDVFHIEKEMKLEKQQIISQFNKITRKMYKYLNDLSAKEIESSLPRLTDKIVLKPHSVSIDEDLKEAAKEVMENANEENQALFNPDFLQRFAIADRDTEIEEALQNTGGKISQSGVLSIKSSKKVSVPRAAGIDDNSSNKRGKDRSGSRSNKRKR